MSNTSTNPRNIVPGFWTRFRLVMEAYSESEEERLERRVRRLETEVERLLAVDGRVDARRHKSA
jgi:hypothetical protein